MNLNSAQLTELNSLLKSPDLELPSFRREVRSCGTNYEWLQKNLLKRNQNAPGRLQQLLCIEKKKVPATEVEGG